MPSAVGRGRYSPRMRPLVNLSQWKKGSQWFQIDRALAIDIVSDQQYRDLPHKFTNIYGPMLTNIEVHIEHET